MLVIKDLLALKQHIDQATFIELKNKAGQVPKLFCFNITQILQHYSKDVSTHNIDEQICQGSQRSKRNSLITSSKISQQLLHTHFLIPQTRITKHIKDSQNYLLHALNYAQCQSCTSAITNLNQRLQSPIYRVLKMKLPSGIYSAKK